VAKSSGQLSVTCLEDKFSAAAAAGFQINECPKKGKQMDGQNAQIFTVPVVGVPAMRNREALYNAKVVLALVSSRWNDGHTGHCSGSPIKLTANLCTKNF
jgi:hypothetical protein